MKQLDNFFMAAFTAVVIAVCVVIFAQVTSNLKWAETLTTALSTQSH